MLDDNKLLELAVKAREKAYTPYSKFKVGASLLTEDGTVFLGCNIENASYGLSNCAERTAIFKAISEGAARFKKMAVVADTEGPVAPCGACRQVMAEFFSPDMEVILSNVNGQTVKKTVAELLPGAFTQEDLNEQNRL